jgi:hypothetical protein
VACFAVHLENFGDLLILRGTVMRFALALWGSLPFFKNILLKLEEWRESVAIANPWD